MLHLDIPSIVSAIVIALMFGACALAGAIKDRNPGG